MTIGATSKSRSRSLRFKVSPPPVSTVVTFNGTVSDIPDGWALADGQNGTVNLQGYFVEGTDTDSDVKTTEGEDTKEVTTLPNHTHPDATWNSEDGPRHEHSSGENSSASSGDSFASDNTIKIAYPDGSGDTFDRSYSHSHSTDSTTSTAGSGSPTVENRPSYVEMHYIEKIEQ